MPGPIAHPMLEELCRARYGRLVALATMLLGSRTGAEDIVQEALVSVFSKPRSFVSVDAAEAYARTAVVSRFLDAARKATKERDSLRRQASRQTWIVDAPEAAGADVEILLSQLPPRVRACVALRFLDDMSVADTAAALGLSDGAVKRYVSDGLAALNAALGTHASVQDDLRAPVANRGEQS